MIITIPNHGQALESFISNWFKEIAYSIILLRNTGYPCVFYGDYYGIAHDNISKVENLDTLMRLRKEKAYGEQHDYFDDALFIGWTGEGDEEHIKSGLAVVISNAGDGEKKMYIGKHFAEKIFIDALGHVEEEIVIDEEGYGIFKVKSCSVSVWVES